MNLTTNTRPFIEAEQYSQFILLNLHDGLLPETFYRNVSDFGSGDTLHIKTVGSVTLQEAAEDTPLTYNPIETGEVTLTINEYKGDAWYVTDDLREDGSQIDTLMGQRAAESTRAFQEVFETTFLANCESAQTDNDQNLVNGQPHRVIATGTNNVFNLAALIQMRLSFDKANVPAEGRVFICDPVVEATLNGLVTVTHDVTPFGASILQEGMARGQRFVMNLYGWDIIVSNRLAKGTFDDDTSAGPLADAVANVCMCVLDDQTKPIMGVIRRMPKVEGERNKDRARDEFVTRSRYDFGAQRVDTLGIIITAASTF
jgi:hypothetical protein